MSLTVLTYNDTLFRATCPEFSSLQKYPEALLQSYWDTATQYMTPVANFGALQQSQRQLGLNFFIGHLLYLSSLIEIGQVPYLMQTATIDKVAVGLTPPPLPNQFQWWLNQSPRGQQLLGLLQANSVGGFYLGGSGPLAAFGYQGGARWWGPGCGYW